MRKVLFPCGISLILVLVFQLVNAKQNYQRNDDFIRNSKSQTDEFQVMKYLENYNPSLYKKIKGDAKKEFETGVKMSGIRYLDKKEYALNFHNNSKVENERRDVEIDKNIISDHKYTKQSGIKMAYIQLSSLYPGAYQSFMKSLESLAGDKGLDTLVIDLRNNSEGNYEESVKIANQLVFESDILLITEAYFDLTINKIKSRGKVFYPLKKIIILNSDKTSGPAEMLALMLKKGKNVAWMGQQTAGDRLLKKYFPLSSGRYVSIPVGYFCEDCTEADADYDQGAKLPLMPGVRLNPDEIGGWLEERF